MVVSTETTTWRSPSGRLGQLEDELAGLADATFAARCRGDVVEWVRLLARGEDLPGEIARARAMTNGDD